MKDSNKIDKRKTILPVALVIIIVLVGTIMLYGYHLSLINESYLPPLQKRIFQSHKVLSNGPKLKNSFFTLFVDEQGSIGVKTISGRFILSDLSYYASYRGAENNYGLKNVSVQLLNDSSIIINGEGALKSQVSILLSVPKNEPKLNFKTKILYNKNTIVKRESLIAVFDVPVSVVYKKNRQMDTHSFQSEYWLERQGVRFGDDNWSALIYHTPGISSLQLQPQSSLLFINLDYYMDHPLVHIPYQEDGGGRWEDVSTSVYSPGKIKTNYFSVYFGNLPEAVPRIMLVPFGNLAGFVFTEHADGGTIKTHRAVYFGREDILNAKDAVAGFVGHKISTTKSVFYANPDSAHYCSIVDDPYYPEFLNFLDQLNHTGLYEICLHTPEGLNSNREVLKESIKFMKERFDTKTWIDHGMGSGKINREAFVADGLNPNSDYFAADLWKKYNTRYFWNPAMEMIRESSRISAKKYIKNLQFGYAYKTFLNRYLSQEELNDVNFISSFFEAVKHYWFHKELNLFSPYQGEAYPTPLFWKHPTRTEMFYSWPTDDDDNYHGLSSVEAEWCLKMEKKQLDKLITEYGVFIDHGYYIRNHKNDGTCKSIDGKIVINPYFDKILGYMGKLRDSGELYITTIRDLLDYWILLENISFKYLPDGEISVTNNNDKPIMGLSLAIRAAHVRLNGLIPNSKTAGEDTIIWFDIRAGEKVILKVG